MAQAKDGDTVLVHYHGTLGNGSVFDSSADRDPLEVMLGAGQVIPGFETAILGMAVGDRRTVTLDPDQAYGEHHAELVHEVPRGRIPRDIELEIGAKLGASSPDGGRITLVVVDFDDQNVKLDANHPLAGEALTFEIELVEIR